MARSWLTKAAFVASATSGASLNMPHGTAPSAPTDGDMWTTTGGLYLRVNGSTLGPFIGQNGNSLTLSSASASQPNFNMTNSSADDLPVGIAITKTSTSITSAAVLLAMSFYAKDTGGTQQTVGTIRMNVSNKAATYLEGNYDFRLNAGGSVVIPLTIAHNAVTVASVPLITAAASTSIPSLRLPHGTAPSSPTNGDIWTTTAGIYVRINGGTVGPLGAAGGSYVDTSTNQTVGGIKTFTSEPKFEAGIELTNGSGGQTTLNVTAVGLMTHQPVGDIVPLTLTRGTDVAPAAAFIAFRNAAAGLLSQIDVFGKYIGPTAATTTASLNLPHGTAPTSPTNGDVWTTTAGVFVRVNSVTYGLITRHSQVFSRAGNLAVVAGAFRWYCEYAGTVLGARATVTTAPTGSSAIFDVNKNGTSLWNGTPGNRPTITASNFTSGFVTNMDTGATITAGDYFTVDIDQIGSTITGANLTVTLWVNLA